MEILAGRADALAPGLMSGLARYRHRVFVEKLGWNLACPDGAELDQFDRADTLYLVARRDDGELVGTARLLPTHRPYLLGDVFPQLMGASPLPNTPDVWELSRFAAVDFDARAAGPLSQFSSVITIDLLRKALSLAARKGVRRLISVSPLGVERLLRTAGFRARRAGPPLVINGQSIFACWIEVQGQPLND
ncbi:GNAT family N-acetyltransferase [Variovorax sp. ZS18.2.2]|uniref:acyl-homoserine-lactone synthase n=1 Tax=Variovorax sp. ZS18.2.2 TaxID=2971255 RepID=UPI002151D5A7|nr:acyl-homoserine-lactone synthase [Variovorax sp. ZS18.2.2]MCR6480879.1 GNAT family N-acetyltransferase [Variovorax sp. ZS18.2.2]